MTQKQEEELDALLDVETGLSGGAIDFLDSLDNDRTLELTEKQADWLDDLYDKHC
jgi:hypothetical protein